MTYKKTDVIVLHVTTSGDVGGLMQSYIPEFCMHRVIKNEIIWFLKHNKEREKMRAKHTDVGNKISGGNKEGSNLP